MGWDQVAGRIREVERRSVPADELPEILESDPQDRRRKRRVLHVRLKTTRWPGMFEPLHRDDGAGDAEAGETLQHQTTPQCTGLSPAL